VQNFFGLTIVTNFMSLVNFTISPWSDVRLQFNSTLESIRRQSGRLKELAQAINSKILYEQQAKLVRELHARLDTTPVVSGELDRDAPTHCDNIPFPKNPHFSGREDILSELHRRLDSEENARYMKSLALWGMGGIGKTQIALEYAYQRIEQGARAVFWAKSDTSLDLAHAFTDIGTTLGLKEISDTSDHEQNRYHVMKWLQKTSMYIPTSISQLLTDAAIPWLLVFDNVESPDNLQSFWPSGRSGSVLITSRNNILAFNPASSGIEVPVFSEVEGTAFLQTILERGSYTEEETISAKELSRALDGLPLALNLMGAHIRARNRKIGQFLIQYQNHSSDLHRSSTSVSRNIYYSHSINTVWETSFGPLDFDSTTLMAVLSFLDPEQIPQELFTPKSTENLAAELNFCQDEFL
jgi:NB-ARC domain